MCDLSTAESGAGPIASASNSVVQMAALRSTLRVAELRGNAVRGRGARALVQGCLSAAASRAEQVYTVWL